MIGAFLLLGLLGGASLSLPISGPAHTTIGSSLLGYEAGAAAAEPWVYLSVSTMLLWMTRRSWFAMVGDGIFAVARPALFQHSEGAKDVVIVALAAAVSTLTTRLVEPFVIAWQQAPLAIGLGFLGTAVALGSTAVSDPSSRSRPSLVGAILVGICHGLAVLPGCSSIGLALTALLWLGVQPSRALELSLLITAPLLLAHAIAGLARGGLDFAAMSTSEILATVTAAFLASGAALWLLHHLVERRRLAWLTLWLVPMGLSTLAYAHTLDGIRV